MKKHIFNAGPCKLPEVALENTAKAVVDLNGIGQSIMEVSHRGKDFQAIMDEAQALMKEILGVPEGYSVLFLGGGASTQFAMIPMNFLKKKAFYLNTGTWSTKAIKEAKLFGQVLEVSSEDANFNYIPKGYEIAGDVDYVHITTNNTIKGTEILEDMDFGAPLVADMSSDFLSRPVDVSKYHLIYGGAQKNLGPAGVTFVIIKDEWLKKSAKDRKIPSMLQYKLHMDNGSMYNTPPVVNVFTVNETLKWVKAQGGVKEMDRRAQERADLLYNAIDSSKMFVGTVEKEDRSRMNICFVMEEPYKALEADFIEFCKDRDIVGIKGHRSVGGFRASCYNALETSSVQALVDAMNDFEKAKA